MKYETVLPLTLLVRTWRPKEGFKPHQLELQHNAITASSSQRGTNLVVGEAGSMEWHSSAVQTADGDYHFRCLSTILGNSLPGQGVHKARGCT